MLSRQTVAFDHHFQDKMSRVKYELTCPSCKHVMRTPFARVGATASCRACHAKFPVKAELVKQVTGDTRVPVPASEAKTSASFNPLTSVGETPIPPPKSATPHPATAPTPPPPTPSTSAAVASQSDSDTAAPLAPTADEPAFALSGSPRAPLRRPQKKKRSFLSVLFIVIFVSVMLATILWILVTLYMKLGQESPVAGGPGTTITTPELPAKPAPLPPKFTNDSILDVEEPPVKDPVDSSTPPAPRPTNAPDAPAPAAQAPSNLAPANTAAARVLKFTLADAAPPGVTPFYAVKSPAGRWIETTESPQMSNSGLIALDDIDFLPKGDEPLPTLDKDKDKDRHPVPGAFTANAMSVGLNAIETATLRLELVDDARKLFARFEQPINLVTRTEKRAIRIDIPEKYRAKAAGYRWKTSVKNADVVSSYYVAPDAITEVFLLPNQAVLKLSSTNNSPIAVTKCFVLVEVSDPSGASTYWTAAITLSMGSGETRSFFLALPIPRETAQAAHWNASVLAVTPPPAP